MLRLRRAASREASDVRLDVTGSEGEANRQERFRLIYQANSPPILGYVLRRTQSPDDAADVVAETFLTAWRRLDDLPRGLEARLWLYGVARRVLANHRRGERRRLRLTERLRDDIAQLLDASEPALSEELEAVVQALGQLREKDREILGLVAWEGLSHEELGSVLGCSPNAAKIRLHRARRRLARRLTGADLVVKPKEENGHTEDGRVSALPEIEEDW